MYDEKALTKHYRHLYAKLLLKERKAYQKELLLSGLDEIKTFNGFVRGYRFICSTRVIHFSAIDDIDFYEVQKELHKAQNTVTSRHSPMKVVFDTIGNGDTCGCTECCGGCDLVLYVEICSYKVSLSPINRIRSNINHSIKSYLRDARFKLQYQPNSKDSKHYIEIINNNK